MFYIVYSTRVSGFYISSFILQYSLKTLFIQINPSWLIHESIKASETRTSVIFKLSFSNNINLSMVFFFFFIIDLYFLIPAVIAQMFISNPELVIPTWTQTNQANAEI